MGNLAKSEDDKGTQPTVDALGPMKAIHVFAEGLTERVKQLDRLEREFRITPQMSTEILTGMIENFVWAVVQTLRRQDKVSDLAKIDSEAIEQLLKSDILDIALKQSFPNDPNNRID